MLPFVLPKPTKDREKTGLCVSYVAFPLLPDCSPLVLVCGAQTSVCIGIAFGWFDGVRLGRSPAASRIQAFQTVFRTRQQGPTACTVGKEKFRNCLQFGGMSKGS